MSKDLIQFHNARPYPETDNSGIAIPFTISEATERTLYNGWDGFTAVRERIKVVLESRGYILVTVEWENRQIVALKET